jgi:hypothetical protein
MKVYYERLLKLTNSFQHRTTNSFLSTIFKSRLQHACSNNMHEEKNPVVT